MKENKVKAREARVYFSLLYFLCNLIGPMHSTSANLSAKQRCVPVQEIFIFGSVKTTDQNASVAPKPWVKITANLNIKSRPLTHGPN